MTSINDLTIDITAYGETMTVYPQFDRYLRADGPICLSLICDEGPYCKVTVNLPEAHLNEGELLIKDWAENEPAVQALLEAGWLEDTGREVLSGFVVPKVMRPAGALLAEMTRLGM